MSRTIAVWSGKLCSQAIRAMGFGLGSNLPGRLSRRINSSVLAHLAGQARRGVLAVSGTNGKSTTAGLIAAILARSGMKLVHNRQGANLITGITACVVNAASWQGKLEADYCLFEIDEAALPQIAAELKIDHVLVTNLFRDQLDRFGELDTTARLITRGILQNKSSAVLNADDPNVAQMVPDCQRLFYGIKSLAPDQLAAECTESGIISKGNTSELSYCSRCQEEYGYTLRFYGQLGHYRCSKCGNERPHPDVYADDVSVSAFGCHFLLVYGKTVLDINLSLPGLFNVYNALAAASLAFRLGIDPAAIKEGLSSYATLFGRSEKIRLNEKQILIQLIKNPAGASQAVRAAAADPQGKYLIAINDNYADGRDISWLWDAEFEVLSSRGGPFVVSGQRCHDMALRLKYAGVDPARIQVEPSLAQALDRGLCLCSQTDTLWLMPTYTCLLELQKIMKGRGCPLAGT